MHKIREELQAKEAIKEAEAKRRGKLNLKFFEALTSS